jgi:acetone carboxylase gamma subunit
LIVADFHKADIEKLIDGVLPWTATQDMLKSPKDSDRFDKYVEIMQARVEFDDPILLPLTPMLFIVSTDEGRVVKCRCGHGFGDYRVNWKLSALINVRDDEKSMGEIYRNREMPAPGWIQLREYICEGCGSQLEVEAVPRGCPPDFEFLPDLDTFYGEWLGRPLPDTQESKDLTLDKIAEWSK